MDKQKPTTDDATIGRLLDAAGRRPTPDAEVTARLERALRESWENSISVRNRRRRPVLAALAASMLVGIALGIWTISQAPQQMAMATVARVTGPAWVSAGKDDSWHPLRQGQELARGVSLRTEADARLALAMHGMDVRIDANSAVTLSGDELSLERGAVYLDSEHAPADNDLTVRTLVGVFRHLGTRYEVRLEGEAARLRVREGRVSWTHADSVAQAEAGHELFGTAAATAEKSEIEIHGPHWRWAEQVAPEFDIAGRRLDELIGWAARETGKTVRYQDAATRRQARAFVLRGSISALSPAEALSATLATTNLDVVDSNGTLLIVGRQ